MPKLRIGFMYPALMDLYGDKGNVTVLQKRMEWRNLPVEVQTIQPEDTVSLRDFDLLMMGGGMDRDQEIVAADLGRRREDLAQALEAGTVVLAICGSYQLLGHYFQPLDGERIDGLGLLDLHTVAGTKRLVGNVALETPFGTVVGYENHSGRTYLGKDSQPLGKVLSGYGNNAEDGLEGILSGTIVGTYLHGPLLPKNPALADHLLSMALKRHGHETMLSPLDDSFEEAANRTMRERLLKRQ
ncbi:MAG: type 1 glutamine amidotransferase [Bacteroidota bacterium]